MFGRLESAFVSFIVPVGAYLYVAVTHALRMAVLDGVQQLAQVENSRVASKPAVKRAY